jgi:hypothetical protein
MGKGSSGGGTNTVTNNSQPPAAVMAAYTDAYQRAQSAANQPYTPYGGQVVADWNPYQDLALTEAGTNSGNWQPFANSAQDQLAQANQPLYNQTGLYMSPYIQSVVDATQNQFNNQNAIQQAGIVGNAVTQGAWGGDRSAVAQALTAGQQQTAQAPVIAGLYNQGYQQAMSAAEAQAWLHSQAAGQYGQLGTQNFAVDQATLNQLMQFGQLSQAQNQAQLNVPYYQYQAGQAYPFQTAGFLANVAEGIGSGMGGSSSTTSPGPSTFSQIAGTGIGAAGLIGSTGGFGAGGWLTALLAANRGGRIPRRAPGGFIPYQSDPIMGGVPDTSVSIVPSAQGSGIRGLGPPKPPAVPSTSSTGLDLSPSGILKLGSQSGAFGANGWLTGMRGAGGQSLSGPTDLTSAGNYGGGGDWSTGGIVGMTARPYVLPQYDEGGDVNSIEGKVVGEPIPLDSLDTTEPAATAVRAGIAPTLQGIDPSLNGIVKRESAGRPFVGYTSPETLARTGRYTDLSNAPVDETGAPIWDGDMGPAGVSTAFGPAQITRTTWAPIAKQLGITDWRAPGAYAAVANALHAQEGDAPWAASAPGGGGVTGRRTQLAQANTGIASDASPPLMGSGIDPRDSVTPAATETPSRWDNLTRAGVNPWLAVAAAGFGMAAGRSPSALQNIGAGALEGIKFLESERQALPEQRLKGAQATVAEAQALAYPALNKWSKEGAVSTINNRIAAAGKDAGAGGETVAVPTPGGGAIAPQVLAGANNPAPITGASSTATPGAQPVAGQPAATQTYSGVALTPDQQRLVTTLDQRRAYLDAQYAHYATMPTGGLPNLIDSQTKMLNSIMDQRTKVDQMDPRIAAAGAAMTESAKNPALIDRAGGEQKARTAETIEIGGPNHGYVMKGGVPIAALPQVRTVTDPTTGAEHQEYYTPPLPQQMGGSPQPVLGPGGQPALLKLGPATTEELKGRGEEAKAERERILTDAQGARNQDAILANMDANADKFWSGKFSDFAGDAKAYLRIINPAYNDSVASREQFVKDAGNLTRQATHDISPRAAYQEVQFIQSTLPNPEMSPLGIHSVIGELRGLNDYKVAKAQALNSWMGQHSNSALGFEDAWQSQPPVTPYTFIISRMGQPERQQLFAKWNQTPEGRAELQRIRGQMTAASQAGWLR